jgi:hypothetical protein
MSCHLGYLYLLPIYHVENSQLHICFNFVPYGLGSTQLCRLVIHQFIISVVGTQDESLSAPGRHTEEAAELKLHSSNGDFFS